MVESICPSRYNASSTGEEETADFTLELTDEQLETFATAHYHVFRSNGNGYYKIIYMNGRATLDGNKLVANIRDKQLRVVDKNDSTNGYILVSNEVVFKQIEKNPIVEICSFNNGKWIRITGKLVVDDRIEPKKYMLDQNPNLRGMYSETDPNTAVLYFENAKAVISSFTEAPKTIEF